MRKLKLIVLTFIFLVISSFSFSATKSKTKASSNSKVVNKTAKTAVSKDNKKKSKANTKKKEETKKDNKNNKKESKKIAKNTEKKSKKDKAQDKLVKKSSSSKTSKSKNEITLVEEKITEEKKNNEDMPAKEDVEKVDIKEDKEQVVEEKKVQKIESPKYLEVYSEKEIKEIYKELKMDKRVSYICFKNALTGFSKIPHTLNNLLTIVDYSKPSSEERLFILDLEKKEVLVSSLVSHGKGTGSLYAKDFSNKTNTYKSSAGFYLTGNIYDGKNGDSLELHGMEKGKNDNARNRTIVIHAAKYADPKFLNKYGRLGRSKGCLAVPTNLNKKIINLISGGTVLYVHTDGDEYKEYDFSKIK